MAGLLDPEELEALMAEEQSPQGSGKYNLAVKTTRCSD